MMKQIQEDVRLSVPPNQAEETSEVDKAYQ